MNQEYDLTEPVKAYEYFLKDAVHETASNFFDGLVNKNNIDTRPFQVLVLLIYHCNQQVRK